MEKRTFTCDRCGEPASAWVRMYEHDLLNGMRRDAHNMYELDLCPKCTEQLRKWMEVTSNGDDALES